MTQAMDTSSAPVAEFKTAMGSLAATVTIVTAAHGGTRSGLAVTATCSLCMDPPSMLVCVNKSSNTHDLIDQGGHFAVNLLSEGDGHRELAMTFSDSSKVGEEKFVEGRWLDVEDGAPMLEDGLASIECEVVNRVPMGTHTIFIGRVRRVINNPDKTPLLYAKRRFHCLAVEQDPAAQ